jgi:4-hydroxybenzoate polyprenyltransferase
MQLKHFFQLIRWKNLVLIASMQFLIKHFFLSNFSFQTSLNYYLFSLLVASTILISAGGYIINDINDVKTDLINKPKRVIVKEHISFSNTIKLYYLLNFLGLLCGIILSIKIEKPLYSLYFISIAAILYIYSKYLKGKVIIGNITVSLLLAFSIFIILIFDTPQPINMEQINHVITIQYVIIVYSFCAFLLSLIREVIKDIEDVNGDYNQNFATLPIVYGRDRTRKVTLLISVSTLIFFIYIAFRQFRIDSLALLYLLVLVLIPLLYFCIKLYHSETNSEYSHLSKILKIIILTGILSIPLISNYFINAS